MNVEAASSTRVALWTAVITATATVLTAFVGIVPQLRQGDQQKLKDAQRQIDVLKTELQKNAYTVKGSVKYKKGNTPVTDAVLVAGPADNTVPLDDGGVFSLPNVAYQPYSVTVQTQDGKFWRVLIDPAQPETDTDDLTITYLFSAPQAPPTSAQ
jgi:hypothetical protein